VKFPSFIGGSYESQALTADCERTVNWYPEVLQSKGATSPATLLPTPGVERIGVEFALKPARAHIFINGREFAVFNQYLVEIDETGNQVARGYFGGTGPISGDPATISSNGDGGNQLFITANGNAWYFDLATNTMYSIPALTGKATMGTYLDGYFLCLDSATSTLYISALLDGATWTPGTDFAQRSLAPDKWVSMAVVGRNLWLYGSQTSEVWYDTGGTFPFAPHPSGLINLGCAAPWSPRVLGGEVVWLATSKAGHVCVAKASGFSPSIISTYPMETAFQGYDQIGSAVADSYSGDGHTFYVLNFDFAGATWAWDATTTLWSERGEWIPALGRFTAWRPRFYAHAFGEHRILDSGGGGVYRMASTLTRGIDDLMIRRLRRSPAIMSENKRVFYSSFEVDLEPGAYGLVGEMPVVPVQPLVWRDDTLTGCIKVGESTIVKTAGVNAWDSGDFSSQQVSGNGYVTFMNGTVGDKKAFGLVPADYRSYQNFDDDLVYGFMLDAANRVWTVVNSVNTDTGIDAVLYDVFKIETEVGSNKVTFLRNGTAISSTALTRIGFPLVVKGSLYTSFGSAIFDASILSDIGGLTGESPQVMLRISNDGGRTWLSEEMRGSGKLGEYLTRVRWNRLGASRRRVFEVAVTDDVPWRLTGAYLESSLGAKQA
jgi:hypothetical protein